MVDMTTTLLEHMHVDVHEADGCDTHVPNDEKIPLETALGHLVKTGSIDQDQLWRHSNWEQNNEDGISKPFKRAGSGAGC